MKTEADLLLGRQAEALDASNLVEECGDGLLVDLERQVADEQCVALGAQLVIKLLGTFVGTSARVLLGLAAGEVDSHVTTIQESTLLVLEGSLGVLGAVEVNVSEATRPTVLAGDDAGTSDTRALRELLVEEVVINLPAEVADEEGRALL